MSKDVIVTLIGGPFDRVQEYTEEPGMMIFMKPDAKVQSDYHVYHEMPCVGCRVATYQGKRYIRDNKPSLTLYSDLQFAT